MTEKSDSQSSGDIEICENEAESEVGQRNNRKKEGNSLNMDRGDVKQKVPALNITP